MPCPSSRHDILDLNGMTISFLPHYPSTALTLTTLVKPKAGHYHRLLLVVISVSSVA